MPKTNAETFISTAKSPNESKYEIYYDFANESWSAFTAFGFNAILLFSGLISFRARKYHPMLLIASIILLATAVISIPLSMRRYEDEQIFKSALSNGECQVLEGEIKNYQPIPKGGRGWESIEVQGTQFRYSDGFDNIGFHRTARTGTILHNGLFVRLHFSGQHILRIEIRKKQ
jgi:hypothetical protein